MLIARSDEFRQRTQDPKHFVGNVTIWRRSEDSDTAKGRVVWVSFEEPDARTYWHTHQGEQVLFIVRGEGRVKCDKDAECRVVRSGDSVYIEANEKHWHGAAPNSVMEHLAVTVGETYWTNEIPDLGEARP